MANDLLLEIERFLNEHKMAESTFGRKVLGDWRLVPELRGSAGRKPRRLWPETADKIREWMDGYRDGKAA